MGNFLRTKHAAALLCLLLLLLLPTAPTPAHPQSAALTQPTTLGFSGMNTYITGLERINNDGDDGITTLLARGRAAGVTWAREELSWGNLERRNKGRWDWKYFDQRLLQLAEHGYGIVGMLLTTPKWARVADCQARIERYASVGVMPQDYWCPPANVQDFADYVSATVERYDGDGYNDAPGSPRVAAWQLWNEPNAWETWPGTPAEYGQLLQAGYTAAKAADSHAIVATGGLYVLDGIWADSIGHSDGLRFLDEALTAVPTAWNAFDALAIHPYMPDVAPDQPGLLTRVSLWGRIITARDWLASRTQTYGGPVRPLWISEVGWSTCGADQPDCYALQATVAHLADETPQPIAPDYRLVSHHYPKLTTTLIGKTEAEQANYMVRTHAIALTLGVQHLSYFQLEDKFDGRLGNFWEEAAILGPKNLDYRPKLAYHAYSVLSQQLTGALPLGLGAHHTFQYDPNEQHHPVERYHLRFRRYDNVLVDILWRNQGTQELTLPVEPNRTATLITRDGVSYALTAQQGSISFTVGEQPIYLNQALPPVLSVTPQTLKLLAAPDDPPRTTMLWLDNLGSGQVAWNASSNVAWLRPNVTSGQGWRSRLPLKVDAATLVPGNYTASVTISSNGGTQQIPVELRVVPRVWRLYLPLARAE